MPLKRARNLGEGRGECKLGSGKRRSCLSAAPYAPMPPPFEMKPSSSWFESPWFAALLLALVSALAASGLWESTWPLTHEGMSPVERVLGLSEELRHGDLYPRWLSITYRGKGSPFFNFYAPAFYWVAAALHTLGVPLLWSIKLPSFLLFFLGAWGMYLWTRRHHGSAGGLVAAIVYLFVPYHFLDLYVRGAFAEFSALAILPYLFWSIDCAVEDKKPVELVPLALSSALLVLTHNVSALMITPFAAIYSVLRVFQVRTAAAGFGRTTGAALFGAGLSAFYWLPVILEQRYLGNMAGALTEGYFVHSNHFVLPAQWFSSFWGDGTSVPGGEDTMSFQIGLVLLVALAASLSMVAMRRAPGSFTLALAILGAAALLMTSELSAGVYQVAPVLRYIQFPWRFLGVATLLWSAACASLGQAAGARWRSSVLLGALLLASVVASAQQRKAIQSMAGNLDEAAPHVLAQRAVGSLCSGDEYLPAWTNVDLAYSAMEAGPSSTSATFSNVHAAGHRLSFSIEGREKLNTVIVPSLFFPGWQATAGGKPLPLVPSKQGLLELSVPRGHHEVTVEFGTTLPRLLGWAVAAVTLLAMLLWFLAERLNPSQASLSSRG